MYDSSDLRKGLKIEIDGDPYVVVQFEFVKPGKGQALYKCRLKNMITGSQFDRTYRSGEKFKEANLEEVEMEYLYADGDSHVFMNNETYDQLPLPNELLGKAMSYLLPNTTVKVILHEERPVGLELPNSVKLKILETEPGLKGATAAGSPKPATLETGLVVSVPQFVEVGETIEVDTRNGTYLTRA